MVSKLDMSAQVDLLMNEYIEVFRSHMFKVGLKWLMCNILFSMLCLFSLTFKKITPHTLQEGHILPQC